MHKSLLITIALLLGLSAPAFCVAPSLGQIMPRGGQRGQEVEFTFPGGNLADATGLLFYRPGISVTELTVVDDKSVKAKLNIAPDCAVGLHAVRVITRTGVSNLEVLSVSALAELTETEGNSVPEEANPIEMNCTINGVVTSEDLDYYSVNLNEGDRIAVEVEALRLGGPLFDPKLRLFGPAGHEHIAEDDTQLFRQDAGFVYTATETGTHLISVSEASYGGAGNYHYRLHVGSFPRPFAVTPMGGAPGSTVTVTWLGDSGLATQEITVPDLPLGTAEVPVEVDGMVAPTPMPFRISDLPGVVEAEPNNGRETATPGQAPGAFDGVIGEEEDHDFFSFSATKDQVFNVRVWARELGSPLDSVAHVFKPDGGTLAGDDDAAGIDSNMTITIPEDGVYTVRVLDHLRRGGPTFSYRVEITAVEPELRLSLLENRPVSVTVPQNNQTYLLVNASRKSFDGPLGVTIDGLPEGITLTADTLPAGQTTLPVILTASAEAPVGGHLLPLTGKLQEEGKDISGGLDQEVRLIQGQNDTTFYGRQVDKLAFTVADPAPFTVELVAQTLPMVQNSARSLPVIIHRAEGFNAEVKLKFPWLPTGMGGGTTTIPGDQSEGTIRLEVRGDAAVGTHQLFVAADGAGYSICTPLTPIEVQSPWVGFTLAEVEGVQGESVEFPVTLAQNTPFEGTSNIELLGLPKGVTAEPQPFTAETAEVKFTLNIAADSPEGKFDSITAMSNVVVGDGVVLHNGGKGQIRIYKPLPPELKEPEPEPAPAAAAEEKPVEEVERKTRFSTK